MNKVLYILILTLGVVSCSKQELNNKIVIIGNNPDLADKKVSIENLILYKEAIADSEGKFIIEIDASFPQYFKLNSGVSKKVYLLPGDTLFIDKDNIKCNLSSKLNNYLELWDIQLKGLMDTIDQNYFSKNPIDFHQTLMSYKTVLTDPLNNLKNSDLALNSEFSRLEKNRIMYLCYIVFLQYEQDRTIETGKIQKYDNEFYSYKTEIDFNDSTMLQYSEYISFISSYIILESIKRKKTIGIENITHGDETEIILDIISQNITNQTVKDKFLLVMMKNQCARLEVDSTQFTRFSHLCSNNEYIEVINSVFNKYNVLLPSRKAPDFSFLDRNNKRYSLSDFKGKYLLLDIWGITCGPCIKEMPKLKELKQKFADEDIVFVCCYQKLKVHNFR